MSYNYLVPTEAEISAMLGMLYGDGLRVDRSEKSIDNPASAIYASYIDENGRIVAAAQCDLQFAAYSAAALSMIPVDVAQEAVRDKALTTMMRDNLHELMNICSRFLMSDETPHLRFDKVYPSLSDSPNGMRYLLDNAQAIRHFDALIPKYGKGKLSFIAS
ncbi:MAG: hypothetical protein ACFCUJ_10370 [Thiotrichales bacterium]